MTVVVKTVLVDPILGFSVNSPPLLEPILVVGLGCHWGYDSDFDPWPDATAMFETTVYLSTSACKRGKRPISCLWLGGSRTSPWRSQPICPEVGGLVTDEDWFFRNITRQSFVWSFVWRFFASCLSQRLAAPVM